MIFNWFKKLFLSLFKVFAPYKAVQTQTAPNLDMNGANKQEKDYVAQSPKDRIYEKDNELNISYYPQLIDHLEMDHQKLLHLYTNIGETLGINEYALIPGQLNKFKGDLKAHLNAENIKFYGYLEQSLKDQSEEFASLRRFRKEMHSIERTVIKFLDHWIENGINTQTHNEFKEQYEAIGSALVKRIESEEKELYTLYSRA